jgi:hypothetical protein
VIGVAVALALISAASQNADASVRARQFLEAFAIDPVMAKQFVTTEATIVVGDIGGSYDEYVKVIRSAAPDWLKACHVGQLVRQPSPTAEELKDGPPRYQGGTISVLKGSYSCARQNDSKSDVEFTLVMKDDLVVDLYVGDGR